MNWGNDPNLGTLVLMLAVIAIAARLYWRPPWKGSTTAHGSAAWENVRGMLRAGLFSGKGLVLGRTLRGRLLTLPHACHVLLIGGTGSGKGIGIIIPALLHHVRCSCVCFDIKSDLIATSEARKRAGHRIIDLAPFAGGKDKWNICDSIRDGPLLVDQARAVAEMLVIRIGTEPDPHWPESAVMLICAVLVFVLIFMAEPERNLNTVREVCADPALLNLAAEKLIEHGGIPARMGHYIQGLQEKERSSILSSVARALSFLDSEMVAAAVATSTFDPLDLCKPGKITLYIRIGADQLQAQRALLRCWIGTLVRLIGIHGNEKNEVLFLIDEASALDNLPALEEALVRGRSAGTRLLLAYQSESQVRAAFATKPTLIQDNCDTTIFLCPPSGPETAEAIAKRIGETTITTSSASENESRSWQNSGPTESEQHSRSWGTNYAVHGRHLLKPEEISVMRPDLLIAFVRGLRPILARRIAWFADPAFTKRPAQMPLIWWLLVLLSLGVILWGVLNAWF
jgi:type IV secretion system protein VirD4